MISDIKTYWFRGDFLGYAQMFANEKSTVTILEHDVHFVNAHITNAVALDTFEYILEKRIPFVEIPSISNCKIRFKGPSHDSITFSEDLTDLLVNEVQFVEQLQIDGVATQVFKGIVYFKKTIEEPKVVTTSTQTNKFSFKPILNTFKKVVLPEPTINTSPVDSFWVNKFATHKRSLIFDILWVLLFLFIGWNSFLFPVIALLGVFYLFRSFKNMFSGWNKSASPNLPPRNSNNWGCMTVFWIGLVTFFLVYSFFTGSFFVIKYLLLFIFIWWLFRYLFSSNFFVWKIFKTIGNILAFFLLFIALIYFLNNKKGNLVPRKDNENEDFVRTNKVRKAGDTLYHDRNWVSLKGPSYNGTYYTLYPIYASSERNRNLIEANDIGQVYANLARKDIPEINNYVKVFDSIINVKHPNQIELADIIVSSIQEIPYVLVHDLSCVDAVNNSNSAFLTEYHRSGKECLPNIKYGVQSGYEFMHNLKGDCDTRSLLCFELLDYYKYPVALLVSLEYGHCILGIDLPLSGLSKSTFQHRYLVWETTAKHFKPGELPPQVGDMNKWQISLTNKY
jgi:hypothetical protein